MNKVIIAKDGFNAFTETDPNNLKFSSDYNTFKYYLSGTANFTITAGETSGEFVIVNHYLDYIPFFVVYGNDAPTYTDRWYMLPYSFADAGVYDHRFIYATKTQIIFRFENSVTSLINPESSKSCF